MNPVKYLMLTFVFLSCLLTQVCGADLAVLSQDNNRFAELMYSHLAQKEGNLFFSPYSISTALSMTMTGARGESSLQIKKALQHTLKKNEIHNSFREMSKHLQSIQEKGNVELEVANSLWPDKDYSFLSEFLETIKRHYNCSLTAVDFQNAAEDAREAINAWVENSTNGIIKNLLPPNSVNALTRLVLVNAIYFKGDWKEPFDKAATSAKPFYRRSGDAAPAPMMKQTGNFSHSNEGPVHVLEMPYAGDELSMLVFLPAARGDISFLENKLAEGPGIIEKWAAMTRRRKVQVILPRFKIEWGAESLVPALRSLGMSDPFRPGKADFSGMDGSRELFIADVVQKAFVEVNEEGTEAAAATGVTVGVTSMPAQPEIFRADHPFMFVIRENSTGNFLFMGRLENP